MTYYSEYIKNKKDRKICPDGYNVDPEEYKKLDNKKIKVEKLQKKLQDLEIIKANLLEEEALKTLPVSYYDKTYITKNMINTYYRLSDGKMVDELPNDCIIKDLGIHKHSQVVTPIGMDPLNDIIYNATYNISINSSKKELIKKFIEIKPIHINKYWCSDGLIKKDYLRFKFNCETNTNLDLNFILKYKEKNVNFLNLLNEGISDRVLELTIRNYKNYYKNHMTYTPVNNIYGINYDDYILLKDKNYLNSVLTCLIEYQDISYNDYGNEFIESLDFLSNRLADFRFYNIAAGTYLDFELPSLFNVITSYFFDIQYRLNEYFGLMELTEYVTNIAINQGYTKLTDALLDISKYVSLCKGYNLIPITDHPQLKQAINLINRNFSLPYNNDDLSKFYERYKVEKINDYYITYPNNINDLRIDGSTLNYCIVSDINVISNNEGLVFFLREKLDEPLVKFTILKGNINNIKCIQGESLTEEQYSTIQKWYQSNFAK